jgi:hypothetical protein
VTVDCPSDCEYLREARKHEPQAEVDPTIMGNPDIRVTKEFLESNGMLLLAMSIAIIDAARQRNAVDSDLREALAGLIQTYRTLRKGVIYESLPDNPLAASVFRAVQETINTYLQDETERLGMTKTRDLDVLRLLVFFERMALDSNNGRPRSRAFLDALRMLQPPSKPAANPAPSLILP